MNFYIDAEELIPPYMTEARVNMMSMLCIMDKNYAANKVTTRSQASILLFCNKELVIWNSKRQNGVEV